MNISNTSKKTFAKSNSGDDIKRVEPLIPKDPPPIKSKTAEILPERCYIRREPKIDPLNVITVVSGGARFKVIDGSTKDFTHILIHDEEAFVKTDCVRIY